MARRLRPQAAHAAPRGSILVVTVMFLAVLTIVAAGLVTRARLGMEAASQKRVYDASLSCADAAREMLLGQFRAFNVNIAELRLDATLGDRRLASGHYDQFNVMSVRPLSGARALGSDSVAGIANRSAAVNLGGAPYLFTVVCSDSSGTTRQSEVEFFIRFGI